jgi:ankyrin repeat protein
VDKCAAIHANNDYALQWSVYYDHLEVARYLIDQGANIRVLNNKMRNKLLKQETSDKN